MYLVPSTETVLFARLLTLTRDLLILFCRADHNPASSIKVDLRWYIFFSNYGNHRH